MKKAFTLLLLSTFLVNAQNFQWIRETPITLSTNPELVSYPLATDPLGNVYVAGYNDTPYNYTTTFGNVFYKKYNAMGSLLFTKNFIGRVTIYKMISDSQGNIYVSAGYVNSLIVDALSLSTVNQGINSVLIKFDSNGNVLWHKLIADFQSGVEPVLAIAIDNNDAVYIGYDNFNNSYLTKLDAMGTEMMTIFQERVNVLSSIAVDNLGNIYTAGSCPNSNSKFAGVAVVPVFDYNSYATKYNSSGIHQWTKYVKDITCGNPTILANSENEVYFSAALHGSYAFGGITAYGPMNQNEDFFLTRLNANGEFQWVREIPDVQAGNITQGIRGALALDVEGNIYYVGKTKGSINWSNAITTSTTGFYTDGILLKYNSNGDILFAKTAGGAFSDRFDGISISNDGSIYITGLVKENTSFDTIQISLSGNYPFVSKISSTLLATSQNQVEKLVIFPNPTSDIVNIALHTILKSVEIYSIQGQKILVSTEQQINVSNLSKGLYWIKVTDLNDNNFSRKLMIK